MKCVLKWTYKVLRAFAVVAVALVFLIPAILYVGLSLPSVQRDIADRAEIELSRLLTVPVTIERFTFLPPEEAVLEGVTICDADKKPAIRVERLAAGVSFWSLLLKRDIIVTFVDLSGLDASVSRATPDSPLNIQPIIDALKPKQKNKPPTRFDLRINTVMIHNSKLAYDVLSVPADSSRFNPAHLRLTGLTADIFAPRIKNDDFIVDIRNLAFREACGIRLKGLKGKFHVTAHNITAEGLTVDLAASHIAFGNVNLQFDSYADLRRLWTERGVDIDILDGSFIGTTDLVPFVPQLRGLDITLYTELQAIASHDYFDIRNLDLNTSYGLDLKMSGTLDRPFSPRESRVDIPELKLTADAPNMLALVKRFVNLPAAVSAVISNLGLTEIDATVAGALTDGTIRASLASAPGNVDIRSDYKLGAVPSFKGTAKFDSFSGERLMKGVSNPLADLGNISADFTYDFAIAGKKPRGKLKGSIPDIVYRTQHFTDIVLSAEAEGDTYSGSFAIDNPGVYVDLDASATVSGPKRHLSVNLAARDVEPALFNIDAAHPDRRFSIYCMGEFSGPDIDHITGQLDIDDLTYGTDQNHIYLRDLDVDLTNDDGFSRLVLNSDVADATVEGRYRLSALPRICRSLVSGILPALTGSEAASLDGDADELSYSVTIKDSAPVEPLVHLPVNVIHPINIYGKLNAATRDVDLTLDAPYIQQGNKLIENTVLTARLRGPAALGALPRGEMSFSTMVPTKKGGITLLTTAAAANNQVDGRIEWKVARDRDFSGNLSLAAVFSRNDSRQLKTRININPGRLVFNDTVWTVEPSVIDIEGKNAEIHDFRVGRDSQYLTIEGKASPDPDDRIVMTLEDINLDYIFETLNIDAARFGGNATGKFYAFNLFTNHPAAYTPELKVKSLTYNNSLMGDAVIKSAWHPRSKAISLDADITQPNGRHSFVDGYIKPTVDSLDLSFKADKLEIGFLQHYMSAFATAVSGYASGRARLYGSFKLIDMVGDIYGEDVKLTLGFTNTSYSTTDSIHLRPGRIDIPGVTLKDAYGHTARLNGWVTHKCFKEPEFDFRVTDARDLLVYDVKEGANERWYGHVFGSGSASVTGRPGLVDISANIVTGPNSNFTFVLTDELQAQDYNFITFRDRDQARKDSIAALDAPPPLIQKLRERMAQTNPEGPPSIYRIGLAVDVTPQAQVNLIMDPVGGDRIRAYGAGCMRMTYDSGNEDFRLNGTYVVERGKYNFTLQDIIIKEFTIRDGSSISFNGDPYAAQLDIAATYSVNANLSDLDESFLADKELNRTNVPVNALLLVRGDMRQPDISFDLEFPTLTQDTYRKVRSIVNTTEMMNRQIIYLLALNRFYTPDYMTTTKGNELVSVASSTISSQLSNMLGQLSDNWSLSPNFRSDRGDFSDVEVDLALSSHLLNNRLLLNGNFGYRDKALNNNSFIGDFDIEYLLNRRGTIRLKAYNRYNDQNYYLKTALTTQGVGIMFKRDFDNMLSFLHKYRKPAAGADSIKLKAVKIDSVAVKTPSDTTKRLNPTNPDFIQIRHK